MKCNFRVWLPVFLLANICFCSWTMAELRIGDICRIKGQDASVLIGMGLVIGLNGTGDGGSPITNSALAQLIERTKTGQMPRGANGQLMTDQLKNVKNVALVAVTATVPERGGQQGMAMQCQVNAVAAKSLEGGFLIQTYLTNRPGGQPLAWAQGPITIPDAKSPTTARLHNGCRLLRDMRNEFVFDGKITLLVDRHHASFQTTQDIEDLVNELPDLNGTGGARVEYARAINQNTVVVKIPESYMKSPVLFASRLMEERLVALRSDARVVIDNRTGTISIGKEVEIGPVAVTVNNVSVDTAVGPISQFVPINAQPPIGADDDLKSLQSLVDALNALKVPSRDIIQVIRNIEMNGALHGRLIELH